jgi:hypothetical protein
MRRPATRPMVPPQPSKNPQSWRVRRIQAILAGADQDAQRGLFRDIEAATRAAGLGETVDAWGDDLLLLR